MLGFLSLVNEANVVQQKFSQRYENEVDINPILLQARLKDLQKRFETLKPKVSQLQQVRDELVESLLSFRNFAPILDKIPEVSEPILSAEKSLEAARRVAKASGNAAAGKEATRRTLKVDRDARLASAMNLNSSTEGTVRKIEISMEMFSTLSREIRLSVAIEEIQSGIDLILRCGGRLPVSALRNEVVEALVQLSLVNRISNNQELQLSRKFGVLIL